MEKKSKEDRIVLNDQKYYNKHLAFFKKAYNGKYIILHERHVFGPFNEFTDAYHEGIRLFGNIPVFIQKVGDEGIDLLS